MKLIHFLCQRPREPGGLPAPGQGALRAVCADRDGGLVIRLAAEAAARTTEVPVAAPRPEGLLGELASRPNRSVEAWLVFAATPAATSAGGHALGLVSLVSSPSASGARHSIGWLLVHPDARRLGIGRALVARACQRAWTLGAGRVWAESRGDWAAALAFWRAVGFTQSRGPLEP